MSADAPDTAMTLARLSAYDTPLLLVAFAAGEPSLEGTGYQPHFLELYQHDVWWLARRICQGTTALAFQGLSFLLLGLLVVIGQPLDAANCLQRLHGG